MIIILPVNDTVKQKIPNFLTLQLLSPRRTPLK